MASRSYRLPFRRSAVLSAACLVLLATAASAQQPSAATVPPAVGLPTLPVAPAEPSPASLALARDVVVGSGIARSFDVIVPQFLDQISTTVTRTRPDLIRDINAVNEQIKPEFDKQAQDMVTSVARLFAQRLNDKQLKDVGDFFKSASGTAYVAAQPLVMNDLVAQMQGFTQRMSSDMMTRVRVEMKKRGHDL